MRPDNVLLLERSISSLSLENTITLLAYWQEDECSRAHQQQIWNFGGRGKGEQEYLKMEWKKEVVRLHYMN